MLKILHKEIISLLMANNATYSQPLTSREMAEILHVNPSYLRLQMIFLKKIIGVRRGKHGGYFLKKDVQKWINVNLGKN